MHDILKNFEAPIPRKLITFKKKISHSNALNLIIHSFYITDSLPALLRNCVDSLTILCKYRIIALIECHLNPISSTWDFKYFHVLCTATFGVWIWFKSHYITIIEVPELWNQFSLMFLFFAELFHSVCTHEINRIWMKMGKGTGDHFFLSFKQWGLVEYFTSASWNIHKTKLTLTLKGTANLIMLFTKKKKHFIYDPKLFYIIKLYEMLCFA